MQLLYTHSHINLMPKHLLTKLFKSGMYQARSNGDRILAFEIEKNGFDKEIGIPGGGGGGLLYIFSSHEVK